MFACRAPRMKTCPMTHHSRIRSLTTKDTYPEEAGGSLEDIAKVVVYEIDATAVLPAGPA